MDAAITPNNPTLIGCQKNMTLNVVGTYSDESTRDVTNMAIWKIMQNNILTMQANVVDNRLHPGITQIQAIVPKTVADTE